MRIRREDLDQAVAEGLLDSHQAEELWKLLDRKNGSGPRLDTQNLLYYLGALLVIGAMGWFMNTAWEQFGGAALLGIAVVYGLVFLAVGRLLWKRPEYRTPGGLFVTMAVAMVPLAVYGLQRWLDWWPLADPGAYSGFHTWIKGGWFWMEVATILAGVAALRCFRFPFLTAPVALALWYMSMDVTALVYGTDSLAFEQRATVSLWFGLAMLLASFLVDRRTREDFAFWGYLFGTLAFWGGLSLLDSRNEWSKLAYCGINLALMGLAVLLQRRIFLICGALGVCGYLGHLAHRLFKDSLLFPVALSLLGVAIILLGLAYQKRRQAMETWLLARVPPKLLALLPPQRHRA